MTDETTTELPKAICQCGGEIEWQEEAIDRGEWVHTAGEPEIAHDGEPLTNQPPPEGHENFDYLQARYEEELAAEEHLKQGQVDKRVEDYSEHVREIESPGYVPPNAPGDTLAEWIYDRQRKQMPDLDTPWSELHQDDRLFWQHEAAAYRRAVARGGFKDYDPALGAK